MLPSTGCDTKYRPRPLLSLLSPSTARCGCGGIQGPLSKDCSFDFVCIPDNKRV